MGCGSGPLTGRYFPPVGGFSHFLRPGTTKLPLFPRLPLVGGHRRTWLDVALYAAFLALALRALVAPSLGASELAPVAIVVVLMSVSDKTLFLATRSEHYFTTLLCFLFASNWIAGAKAVQLALWFFAGSAKAGPWMKYVLCFMMVPSSLAVSNPRRRPPPPLSSLRSSAALLSPLLLSPLSAPLLLSDGPARARLSLWSTAELAADADH